ncbi:hypothetical protein PBI_MALAGASYROSE_84 [Mycobacterium phage MalagasyRose]|uniref:Uncharacterized protein n=1 Tax=Mycobacterium phage MalagasyRose TaxID=2599870 RepID=A0A5J6TJB9_9CAUD|nr:hypothetical protein QEH39_gp04 [Mycobacterium phage MalagasyRose]QFG08932.1 hypothetical protein PBI_MALAGASYROSE_84 [Mycobacterium phage MalagasyRose]
MMRRAWHALRLHRSRPSCADVGCHTVFFRRCGCGALL